MRSLQPLNQKQSPGNRDQITSFAAGTVRIRNIMNYGPGGNAFGQTDQSTGNEEGELHLDPAITFDDFADTLNQEDDESVFDKLNKEAKRGMVVEWINKYGHKVKGTILSVWRTDRKIINKLLVQRLDNKKVVKIFPEKISAIKSDKVNIGDFFEEDDKKKKEIFDATEHALEDRPSYSIPTFGPAEQSANGATMGVHPYTQVNRFSF